MNFKKIFFLIVVSIFSFGCLNNKRELVKERIELDETLNDSIEYKFYTDINKNIDKHSSRLKSLFKNRIISLGIESVNLKTEKSILVSLVHNVGTFDEMNLITHDLDLNLLDSLYIGTATMFDNGKSHTIKLETTKNNEIAFHHTDWGYINDEDIDTVKYLKNVFIINNKGKIIRK